MFLCVCVFWFLGLEFRNHKSIDAFDDAFLLHRNDLLALKTHRQYSNASRLHNALPKKKKNKKMINWLHCTGRKAKGELIMAQAKWNETIFWNQSIDWVFFNAEWYDTNANTVSLRTSFNVKIILLEIKFFKLISNKDMN